MIMILPEELISYIVEHLAYKPDAPAPHLKPEIQFKSVSSHLCSLSLVNKRLRRICLPFLFAYVYLDTGNNSLSVKRFLRLTNSSVPPELVKVLKLSGSGISLSELGHDHLCGGLAQLTNLSCAHLDSPTQLLFDVLLVHPSVSTVLVTNSIPTDSTISDLSKVVFEKMPSGLDPPIFDYLARGAGLARLDIGDPMLFLLKFKGVRELNFFSYPDYFSPSSLQRFSLAHPHLQRLSFDLKSIITNPPFFISSFLEESRQRNLLGPFSVSRFGVTRCERQGWAVTELRLLIYRLSFSLIEILSIVNTSFPRMRDLSIALLKAGNFKFDDFVSPLIDFAALRELSLHQVLSQLSFTSEPNWEHIPSHRNKAEARIHWCASRLVRFLPELRDIYVNELVFSMEGSGTVIGWRFEGWLHADGFLDDGTVRIAGTLEVHETKYKKQE